MKKLFFSGLMFFVSISYAGNAVRDYASYNTGARPCSMGGAFCAVADDPNAIFFNPAGLVLVGRQELMVTHNEWAGGIQSNSINFVHPVDNMVTMGVSINNLLIENSNNVSKDSCTSSLLSTSINISEKYSMGINIKVTNERIDKKSSNAYTFDFGFLYVSSKINLGLMIANTGSKMKLYEEIVVLPYTVTLGVDYKLLNECIVALDINKGSDIRFGSEYKFLKTAVLRAGYIFNINNTANSSVTIGTGFFYGNYKFDYGFIQFKEIGNTNRISFSVKF